MAEKANSSNTWREIVTGDRRGLDLFTDALFVTREVVTGSRLGLDLLAEVGHVAKEVVTGDHLGRDVYADVVVVVREVLYKEPPITFMSAVREVLISVPAEPLRRSHLAPSFRQSVLMTRPPMPLPSTVKSAQIVPGLREQVVMSAPRTWTISDMQAWSLRIQTVHRRQVVEIRSAIQARKLAIQIVASRNQVYEPVSEVRAASQRQMVVARRDFTEAPQVRTAIQSRKVVEQIVISRNGRPVVITTEAHVPSLVQQAVVADTRPAPHSPIQSRSLVIMTVQRHDVVAPGIDVRAGQVKEQVVMAYQPKPPFGLMMSASLAHLTVVDRITARPVSPAIVAGARTLTVMHRETFPPAYALGRHTASLVQQVIANRAVGPRRSPLAVGQVRLAFILGRTTVPPWEVIDPTIGRHVAALNIMTVHHRATTPPETISKESRFVHNVFGQVALGDKFPLPPYPEPEPPEAIVQQVVEVVLHGDRDGWAPVTAVRVDRVTETLAVGDNAGWVDPTIPVSEISVDGVVQAVAVADSFLDPAIPQSSVDGVAVSQVVVVGDSTMPDPALPLSEVQVMGVTEFAAIGDAIWSDPTIPLSDATVSRLTAFLAHVDPSLIGEVGGSEISSPMVVEFYVIRDPTLKGIPLRQGPRPVVSVTIS